MPAPPPARVRPAARLQRWWWQTALLAALVALVVGGSIQHAVDQRTAARDLYRTQVLTTVSRFLGAERHQIALPLSQRNAAAFETLAGSIAGDLGVNGSGMLGVSPGVGSVAPFTQIAFAPTVSSPYGSTTFVVFVVRGAGPAGMSSQNVGSCVLSSTLLGPGRAAAWLNLGSSGLQPCAAQLWSPKSKNPMLPRLRLAGIPHSGPT